MDITLNSEQSRGLSVFFFDVAKGLVLGGIGLSLTVPLEVKVFMVLLSSVLALVCVRMALNLLDGIK